MGDDLTSGPLFEALTDGLEVLFGEWLVVHRRDGESFLEQVLRLSPEVLQKPPRGPQLWLRQFLDERMQCLPVFHMDILPESGQSEPWDRIRAVTTEPKSPEAPDFQLPADPSGVDDSLILWFQSLTPVERLQVLQDFVDGVTALRNARRV